MRFFVCLFCLLAFLTLVAPQALAGEHGISVGYGFGVLNEKESSGRIEGGKNYDFFQATYQYEEKVYKRLSFVVEPFAAYINRPTSGLDVGLTLLFRFYPSENPGKTRFFADVGGGGAYTSIAFQEQGTHGLFILAGGLGLRYEKYFILSRFRHYSNGGLSTPNRSVHACVTSVGFYF